MDYKVFGCKTNRYFAEKWLSHSYLEGKEGYFIASCVVTDRAKAKWVKYAKKQLPKLQETEKLFLSGCGNIRDGVVDPKFFEIYPELEDYRDKIEVLPEDPEDWSQTSFVRGGYSAVKQKGTSQSVTLPNPPLSGRGLKDKIRSLKGFSKSGIFTRKYLVVQTGCDNFCTFCLTVQARGRHKWRPEDEIIEEVGQYVENGGKEVVFTGINLGAWGAPSSNDYHLSKFVELVEVVLEKTSIERIRISSLGVEFVDDRLIELFKNPRINAYIHLSIQSGSSKILRAMNRHYDGVRLRWVLEKLRNLKRDDGVMLNIGADLIVGFPSETSEDFEMTREIVEKYQITQLHAFPFSPHVDHYSVPAGLFSDQVPNHISQNRVKQLITLGEEVFKEFASMNLGKELHVLIEKTDGVEFSGWSENYLYCDASNFSPLPGQKLERGKIIKGMYNRVIQKSLSED